jgi:peptidoglycan/xylan/chitin deacetylase (PgdA/CDA1 family)
MLSLHTQFYPYRTPAILPRLFSRCLWQGPRDQEHIYITFDDGPLPGITPKVLDMLSAFQQKATFFCVGDNVQRNNDIFREILRNGHDTGNHTCHHLHGWKHETQKYIADVELADAHIGSKLFRPPYGKLTFRQYMSLIQKDYHVVMWSLLCGDFEPGLDKKRCLKKLCQNVRSGDIVVFHDQQKSWKNLEYILPGFLEEMQKRNITSKGLQSIIS